MTVREGLLRLAAFSVGALLAVQAIEWAQTELRFRSVIRTFGSTREVIRNVRDSDDHARAGAGR